MKKTKRKPQTRFRIAPSYFGGWEAWHIDHYRVWVWGKTPFAALEQLKKRLRMRA